MSSILSLDPHAIFAAYDENGAPRKIDPAEVETLLTEMAAALDLIGSTPPLLYSSRATLFADLLHDANTSALVIGDSTVAYNGLYRKNGASGTGSWTRVADLPGYSFIKATNTGAVNPNDIIATTSIPIPAADGGALIALPILTTNNATPAYVTFNADGNTRPIKTSGGTNVGIGGLVAGRTVLGMISGGAFQLLSDQATAGIQAAAEAAQAAAEAARDAAIAAASTVEQKMFTVRVVDVNGASPSTAYEAGDAIDGKTLVAGDLILRATSGGNSADGIYVASSSGAASRLSTVSTYDKFCGTVVSVQEGDQYRDTKWDCISDKGGTLGSTALNFVRLRVKRRINVFATGGQSNMQGLATSASSVAIQAGMGWQYYSSTLTNKTADPIGNANLGGALPAFMQKFIDLTGDAVCIVPCAVGGTDQSSSTGVSVAGNWDASGSLRATIPTNVTAAMAALRAAGWDPIFRGILWSQGENDAGAIDATTITKSTYKTALQTMIAYYRGATIDGTTYPNLPFYISTTGGPQAGDTTGYASVRAAQREVAQADPQKTIVVYDSAEEFIRRGASWMQSSSLHYTNAGYDEMGRCMAVGVYTGQLATDPGPFSFSGGGTLIVPGNGTYSAFYTRRGNQVTWQTKFTLGSTSSLNSTGNVGLPSKPRADEPGSAYALDNGTGHRHGLTLQFTTGVAQMYNDSGTNMWGTNIPMTWTTSDAMTVGGTYMVGP